MIEQIKSTHGIQFLVGSVKKLCSSLLKYSSLKIVRYITFVVDILLLISVLMCFLFADVIINSLFKEQIIVAFTKANPTCSLQLGETHYNFLENLVSCDSILIRSNDSSFVLRSTNLSIGGIRWFELLAKREFTLKVFSKTVLYAQKFVYTFHHSQEEFRSASIHISIADSILNSDSIKYYPLVNDEQVFSKSNYRQTRFRFEIPKLKITGLDFFSFIKGTSYKARDVKASDLFADILVNMDKPYDKNSSKPQMPNEFLGQLKESIKVNSLKIVNGKLKYCERFAVLAKPGVILFSKVKVNIRGIANHSDYTDTASVLAEGVFMNSGLMKLKMLIPLTAKEFSLHYSGSLSNMDVTKLNAFIEPGEHHRIKSGRLQSAEFNINVHSGRSTGTLRVVYDNLSIAILDKKSGSEKGIFNRVLSFIGKIFVIRGSNLPDENGKMKIGRIKYKRDPDDYFLQFVWFSLRNGVADVVGFPSK